MYPEVQNGAGQLHRVRFDTPYLKEPLQYDMNLLPKNQFMPYMNDTLQFIKDNIKEGDPTTAQKDWLKAVQIFTIGLMS